ncbi:alpha/beta hydrolase [Nonomuraea longicatena]|uniref:Alpha/beta hydrolase n=1 Tax=Nonomuraea longicatena TaxID=83682 RepID=A0ABP4ACV1_9ACTN
MRGVLTLAVGLALVGAVPPAAAQDAGPPSAHEEQRLGWGPCPAAQRELIRAGARCAKVKVPLDYADPAGPAVEITVSRVQARSAKRRGILLSNPGGPGGTGLNSTLTLRRTLGRTADAYDLIGFDPRFLGESSPVRCAPAGPARPPGPSSSARADFDRSVRAARDTVRRCFAPEGNAALLPHASTRNVARDMDLIRKVLGEPRLSYYGVSYGADLGAVFAEMFPRSVDRLVLDSATDPAATQYELFRRSGRPLEGALDEWAAWTARRPSYGLGRTRAQVRAGVERLLERATRRPVAIGGTRLDAPLLRLILRQFVQHGEHDAALAAVVRDLRRAAEGRPVEPGPELAAMLELLESPALADGMVGGALFMCGDGGWPAGGWPQDPEAYWRNIVRDKAALPVFGPMTSGMTAPCAFWGSEPGEAGTPVGNAVPALILHARRDANVPYAGAVALHRKMTASRLVTADVRAHGVYGRAAEGFRPVPCADRAVNAYLDGGALPTRDLAC